MHRVVWIIGLIVMSASFAQAQSKAIDIPAQNLSDALHSLSAQTGIQLLFSAEKLKGIHSKAISGSMNAEEALAHLLKGTSYTYQTSGKDTYVIKETENKVADPVHLPEINVTSMTDPNSPYNKNYQRTQSVTATRTDTPIMQTPFSVQIIPRQVLQDRQAVRLETALQNVSGVTLFPSAIGGTDSFMIRGFQTDTYYRNGVLAPNNMNVEMANIQQVEVLKGPASILFGRADPGGVINTVTKQPLATPYYSLQQQAGSFDFYRTAVDATGPLTKDNTLLYRLNLSYENSGSFRDFVKRESVFIAPVVTWNISPKTQITAEFEYQKTNARADGGLAPQGNRPAPIPISRSLDEPVYSGNSNERIFGGINWSHILNDNWNISHRLFIQHTNVTKNSGIVPFGTAAANGTVERFAFDAPVDNTRYQSSLNLVGKITTGLLEHTLLFGYDYFHSNEGNTRDGICCPADTINIFNPTYLIERPVFGSEFISAKARSSQSWHGAYFQDQIKLPYNLHVLGGFRYDNASSRDTINNLKTGQDDRFSPRGGLLWQPMPWLSLYGSYTENFGVSNGLNSDRRALPPQSAQQWETGVKTELFGGRLRTTFSYFELIKNNIAVTDPLNPLFKKAIGEAETRGIELDVAGEILPGWNVIATYSYLPFAKITKDVGSSGEPDDLGNQGNRLFLAAKHTGNLWNTYEFQNELLRGLKIGGGIQAVSKRQGNTGNSFQLPTFVIGNLMASYQYKIGLMRVTAQLNVINVSNERYYAGTNGDTFITPGAPRTVLGSLRLDY